MKNLIFIFTLFLSKTLSAQETEFKVEVSADTVLMGNYFEVKFTIENGKGKFVAPSFNGLKIVAGPNQSSSYSSMNGEVKQSSSYTYYMEADEEGVYIIPSAKLVFNNEELKTPEVKVVVVANPEGIKQNPNSFHNEFSFPPFRDSKKLDSTPTKKQKKTYKI